MVLLKIHLIFERKYYQFLAALTGTLTILASEMHFGWPSPSVPLLLNGTSQLKITTSEASWIVITLLCGNISGALSFFLISKSVGRKLIILLTTVPIFVAWLLIYFAYNIYFLFVARFLAGLANGVGLAVVPIYLAEISDPKLRGFISSFCPISIVVGTLLVNIIGNYMDLHLAALICSAVPLIAFVSFMWMPESPSYHFINKNLEQFKRSYKKLNGIDASEEIIEHMKIDNDKKEYVLWKNKSNRKALLIGIGLRTVQQLSAGTVITFYCKTILDDSNDLISSNISSIMFFLIQLIIVLFSSLIIDTLGRKSLLLISIIGSTLSLLLMAIFLHIKQMDVDMTCCYGIPLVALSFYTVFYSIGLRPVPIIILGEIFPNDIKTLGLSIATICNSLMAILCSKLFYLALNSMHLFFYAVSACGVLNLLFVCIMVPETKGKTLQEIQESLQSEERKVEISIVEKDLKI